VRRGDQEMLIVLGGRKGRGAVLAAFAAKKIQFSETREGKREGTSLSFV